MLRLWTLTAFLLCIAVTAVIFQNCNNTDFHSPQSDGMLTTLIDNIDSENEALCLSLGGDYAQESCSVNMLKLSHLGKMHSRVCQQLGGLWDPQRKPHCLLTLNYRHRYNQLIFNTKTKITERLNQISLAQDLNNKLEGQLVKNDTSLFTENKHEQLENLNNLLSSHLARLDTLSISPLFSGNESFFHQNIATITSNTIDTQAIIEGGLQLKPKDMTFFSDLHSRLKIIGSSTNKLLEVYKKSLHFSMDLLINLESFHNSMIILDGDMLKYLSSAYINIQELSSSRSLQSNQKITRTLKSQIAQIMKETKQVNITPKTYAEKKLNNYILASNYQLLLTLSSLLGEEEYDYRGHIYIFSQINILESRLQNIEIQGLTQNNLISTSNSLTQDLTILLQSLVKKTVNIPADVNNKFLTQLADINQTILKEKKSVMSLTKAINHYAGALRTILIHARSQLDKVSDLDDRIENIYGYFLEPTAQNCAKLGSQNPQADNSECHIDLYGQLQWIRVEENHCQASGQLELTATCPIGYRLIQCFGDKGAYIKSDNLLKQENNLQSLFSKNKCKLTINNPACVSANKENQAKLVAHCAQWKGQVNCPPGSLWDNSSKECKEYDLGSKSEEACSKHKILTFGKCMEKPISNFHIPKGLCTKDNPLDFPSRCTCKIGFSYAPDQGLCLEDTE